MRATDLSSPIWNSLADFVGRAANPREIYFARVIKLDAVRKLIWVEEFGELPIPLVGQAASVAYYDTVPVTDVPTKHMIGAASEPAFLNTWANYGSGYKAAGFWKTPLGIVQMQGLLTLVTQANVNANIWQFPVDFRPSGLGSGSQVVLAGLAFDSTSNTIKAVDLRVKDTGEMYLPSEGGQPATIGWLTLDGLSFDSGVPLTAKTSLYKRDDPNNPAYQVQAHAPVVGDTVVILDPWGVKRFPICIGLIQSKQGFWES